MPWTQTIVNIKDAAGTTQPVIAYTDGTNFSFAHPLLDNTGAIIAPATSGKQDTGNTTLAAIQTAVTSATPAGSAIIGKVTTDQTAHGTTDLVAADITKVAGAAISQGHGTAATAIRVELPTDGTGVVGLAAGSAKVGVFTTDQTTHGTTDLIAADITKVAGAAISQGHGTASTAIRVELPTDGTGVVGIAAGTAIIGKVTTDQTTHGTTDLVAADITKVAGTAIATGHGTASGAIRVELPTDGTGVVGVAAGSSIIGKVGIDQTTPGTTNLVQVGGSLPAGTAIIGKVTTDQTTHGTTDLVAADITKVAGAAISQGHGTAATAIRVELPTDGTGKVGLNAGSAIIGITTTDQTTHGTTDLVAADITKVAGSAISQGHGTAATAIRVELPTDGTGVVGLAAGTALVGKVGIDQTTPGTTNLVQLPAPLVVAGSTTTRPNNTTAYAFGQLVANSTTAGSVTYPTIAIARANDAAGVLFRCRLKKSGTVITNAIFRVHLYNVLPSVTNGDGAAWLSTQAGYVGSFDVTIDKAFSDASEGIGVPVTGSQISFAPVSGTQNLYYLLEARAAYTPVANEVFTPYLEGQ